MLAMPRLVRQFFRLNSIRLGPVWSSRLVATMALALSVGCGSVTPASFRAKAPSVSAPVGAAVVIRAQPQDEPLSRFNASGFAFDLNRDEFSNELARLLEESLDTAGVDVDGERPIRVQVDYLDFMFQGPCILDYRVWLGEGAAFGLQSEGTSSNFATACRGAFEAAVSDIVRDSRTVEFLRGP